MRLQSIDGAYVELSVKGYQFGPSSEPRDWDANWLVVAGVVVLPDGAGWAFEDPCMTTWEIRELANWLREVRDGHVEPSAWDSDEERLLVFTEPNVAFSLAARSEDVAAVRVHLSLESVPPSGEQELFDYFVPLDVPVAALSEALHAWEAEVRAFPVR